RRTLEGLLGLLLKRHELLMDHLPGRVVRVLEGDDDVRVRFRVQWPLDRRAWFLELHPQCCQIMSFFSTAPVAQSSSGSVAMSGTLRPPDAEVSCASGIDAVQRRPGSFPWCHPIG